MKKIILSALVASSLVIASEPNVEKDDKLEANAKLGYIKTSGNTDTTTYSLDGQIKKGWDVNILTFSFDGQYAEDDDYETKNKFFTELEYDYEITDKFAFDYLVGYKSDKFSSYDYQFYTGPGAKYKIINNDIHNLNIEGNVLYSEDETSSVSYATNGDVIDYPNSDQVVVRRTDPSSTDDYISFRAKGIYEWQILENLKFGQELTYRVHAEDSDKYFVFSKTELTSKLSDMFTAGVSYKVDYDNQPASDKEYADKTFSFFLGVDY